MKVWYMPMMIKGIKVYLRRYELEDIETMVQWFTKDREWMLWDAPWEDEAFDEKAYRLNRIEQHKKRIPEYLDHRLEIMTDTHEHIGWVSYYYINEKYLFDVKATDVAIGIVIVDPKHRNKGYGYEALSLLITLLKERAMTDIFTQTWSGNHQMINLALKLGFVEVHRIKDYRIVNHKTYDALTFKLQ